MKKHQISYLQIRMKSLLPLCLSVLMLFTACIEEGGQTDWQIKTGSRAPRFEVTMNDGSVFSTDENHPEKVMIVFFNTGCSDCRVELPKIQKLYDKILSGEVEAIRIVCIARQEDASSIEKYWEENDLTLPYSPQDDRRIFSMFASSGIPRIYILSTDNIILSASEGLEDTASPKQWI